MVTAQVTGVPNPVQVAKGLTDQTWQMPTNYWLVFFVFAFGLGLIILMVWIIRKADKQSDALEKAQAQGAAATATYEALSEEIRDVLRSLEDRIDRVWEEIVKIAGKIK